MELFINGNPAGVCDKPVDTFVFPFEHIDITQSGSITAKAYDYEGKRVAEDVIETASAPSRLKLTLFTGDRGLLADGTDIAYVDVEVLDEQGRLCPLAFDRIDFSLEGEGVFLGGYNSGRFNGFGKEDSVIHQNHVYAECGNNRVFIRSTRSAGGIRLTAKMNGVPQAAVSLQSHAADTASLAQVQLQYLAPNYGDSAPSRTYPFEAIPAADAAKYVQEDKIYCKVLVDGQEPDTRGILSVYNHGSIYSPILFILERIKNMRPELFDYTYDTAKEALTLTSGGTTVTAEKGRTHLLVNGEENLLNGEPYIHRDAFIVEINAVISYIKGVVASYDDNVRVFRIELPAKNG
ncbi:hypothetical protein D3C75_618250 [compost metagenome]